MGLLASAWDESQLIHCSIDGDGKAHARFNDTRTKTRYIGQLVYLAKY